MKKLVKISAISIWTVIFFLTPAAMAAVMGGVEVLAPFSEQVSEQGAMILLGTSLIGMAGLCRNRAFKS